MVSLKRQIHKENEIKLIKQAEELDELKQIIRTKQAQQDEQKQYEMVRQQLMTLQNKINSGEM